MNQSSSKTGVTLLVTVLCAVLMAFAQEPSATDLAGGRGGNPFADTALASGERVVEIQIFAGEFVDGVQMAYELRDGRKVLGPRHGGGGGQANIFRLDSDEYIVGISGRCGEQIDSISIQTNKRTSPLFGGSGGSRSYRLEVARGNQAIGFAGRSGQYLDAIGLVSIPLNLRQAGQTEVFGGRGGSPFADEEIPRGARVTGIRVQSAERVDGIQVLYALPNGSTVEGPYHGGRGGRPSVFRLDPDEYILGLDGRYGDTVDSLTIRTNKRVSQVFGGRGGNRSFWVDVPRGSVAIGFAGRSGESLDAVGLTYESGRDQRPQQNILRRLPGRNRN
jgi:hypothetical protein